MSASTRDGAWLSIVGLTTAGIWNSPETPLLSSFGLLIAFYGLAVIVIEGIFAKQD